MKRMNAHPVQQGLNAQVSRKECKRMFERKYENDGSRKKYVVPRDVNLRSRGAKVCTKVCEGQCAHEGSPGSQICVSLKVVSFEEAVLAGGHDFCPLALRSQVNRHQNTGFGVYGPGFE